MDPLQKTALYGPRRVSPKVAQRLLDVCAGSEGFARAGDYSCLDLGSFG